MEVKLKVIAGKMAGKEFIFDRHDIFIFGRSPKCHCHIPDDPYVSRNHFLLEVNPPECYVRDLGSLNGTYINGHKYGGREYGESPEEAAKRAREVKLKDGDVIQAGGTVFLVQIEMPAECIECGKEIPKEEREEAKFVGGTYLCRGCREKAVRKVAVPKKVFCCVCGKEIPIDEAGGVGRGDYVCADCRNMPREREADILEQILNAFLRGVEKPPEIPDYEIIRQLGHGGMGVVYLARRIKDGAEVALKVMLAKRGRVTEKAVEYFQREMEICRQLQHPNIVAFYEQGYHKGVFYFVMEYCNGGSVDKLMEKRGGWLNLDEAIPIMLQALEGLAYAHERGYVHRDLKPSNILLVIDGKQRTAKISDFGLAKNFQQAGLSGITATGAYAGTLLFVPREQLLDFKHTRPVSDVFSIGATFYNMLTGKYVYEFSGADDPVHVILEGKVVSIRKRRVKLPDRLADIIDRAISPEPSDRFQTAGEMKDEMVKALK